MMTRLIAALGLLALTAFAQPESPPGTVVYVPRLGFHLAQLSDMNGDGIPEYVASRPDDPGFTIGLSIADLGAIEVRDGATDTQMWQKFGTVAGEHFGHDLGVADWNGDGLLDVVVIVQQFGLPGRIDVLDGSSGILLATMPLPVFSTASGAVTHVLSGAISHGDINSDGLDEVTLGIVTVITPANGSASTLISGVAILGASYPMAMVSDPATAFGAGVHVIDDIDADGFKDILITASQETLMIGNGYIGNAGLIRVISGANLTTIWQKVGSNVLEMLGEVCSLTPDLDGDSIPDLVTVGGVLLGNSPLISLISGASGATILQAPYPVSHNPLKTMRVMDDLDGDGFPEVVVSGSQSASPAHVIDIISLADFHHVERIFISENWDNKVTDFITMPDTNGDGWPELRTGRSEANFLQGAVDRRELRPALPLLADGSPLHDLLRVNGSTALPSRRVDLAVGESFTIGVEPDLTTGQPTEHIIWGLIGVPNQGSVFNVTGGSFLFPPRIAAPGLPWLFTLTDSIGYDPAAAFPGYAAPWSIGAPFGIAMPIDLTFQGVTISGGNIDITNGILLSVR